MYPTGSIITSLVTMKKVYQLNILRAWGIVLVIVGMTMFLLAYCNTQNTNNTIVGIKGTGYDVNSGNGSMRTALTLPKKNTVGVKTPSIIYKRTDRRGFISLNGYKIISTDLSEIPKINTPVISPVLSAEIDENIGVLSYVDEQGAGGIGIGFGNGNGNGFSDENDYGLPSGKPYLPPVHTSSTDMENIRGIPAESHKAKISFAEPRWPENARALNFGMVAFLITIEKNGDASWKMMSEYPQGGGFARALRHSLENGWYSPPVVDGVPQRIVILLRYTFCHDCPDGITEVTGNLTAILQ